MPPLSATPTTTTTTTVTMTTQEAITAEVTMERTVGNRSKIQKDMNNDGIPSRRSVSFNEETEIFFVPCIDDYTKEEIKASWFEEFEYRQMKSNNKILAKMIKSSHYDEDDEVYCFRGLECKVSEASRRRKWRKQSASLAVFAEQDRQHDEGIINDELIREVYILFTAECSNEAQNFGNSDAENARCIIANNISYNVQKNSIPNNTKDQDEKVMIDNKIYSAALVSKSASLPCELVSPQRTVKYSFGFFPTMQSPKRRGMA